MSAQLDQLVARLGGMRRVITLLVGLGFAAGILMVSRMVAAPNWMPAVSGAEPQVISALEARLKTAGIPYEVAGAGTELRVAEPDFARARVAMAKDGMPGATGGYDVLDKAGPMMSENMFRTNFRRAIEGELSRTIGEMRGVRRARVLVAMPEQAAFRRPDDRPVTASVVVSLESGATLRPEMVQGIAHLVAASVGGMSSEDVGVHDETGRLLTEPHERGATGTASRQLRLQEETERYLKEKAEAIVEPMVGTGNAHVTVAASMNFTRVDRTTQTLDPEKQALASEQKAEIVPGAQGGAGSTNIANSYENSKSTEVVQGAVGTVSKLTVAVVVGDLRLPAQSGDSVPRFQKRTADELARIEALVRNAIGIDSARGDKVTVQSAALELPVGAIDAPAADFMAKVQQWQRPGTNLLGVVLAFVIAFMAVKALGSAGAVPTIAGSATLGAGSASTLYVPQGGQAGTVGAGHVAYALPAAVPGMRDHVMQGMEQDPDAAARLLKSWISDK